LDCGEKKAIHKAGWRRGCANGSALGTQFFS
jgi:hypothetical protein